MKARSTQTQKWPRVWALTKLIIGFLLVAASDSLAGLGGFEAEDGYEIYDRSGNPAQIPGINLNAYNAGEYGTNSGGLGGSFTPNGSPTPVYTNTGLWTDINNGSTYGYNSPIGDYYIIAHDDDIKGYRAKNGAGMLGMTTRNSSAALDFAYSLDSRDFYQSGVNTPGNVHNNAIVDWSIWVCPTAGTGDAETYYWTFRDSAGRAAGQVGWTAGNEVVYRSDSWAGWTNTGVFLDPTTYDRLDFSFDVANDTWGLSKFDASDSKLEPIFSAAMGNQLDDLARIDWHLEPGILKTFFDDSEVTACYTSPMPLDELMDGQALCSGDKRFTEFAYSPIGDMPPASDIIVHPITDAEGHFGVRLQGAFVDTAQGGASDALIEFKVDAPEGKLIRDVHLAANPLTVGSGDGFVSITETFLSENDQVVLSAYDIKPGSRQLHEWADLVDENGLLAPVRSLHVQKDIVAWAQSEGTVSTLSFIDQTFSQCDEDPENSGFCDLGDIDVGDDRDDVLGGGDTGTGDSLVGTGVIGLAAVNVEGLSVFHSVVGDINSDGAVDFADFLCSASIVLSL